MAVRGEDLHAGDEEVHQDRFGDDGSALRAAHLASPRFKEPWSAGSPLNWCEFIARCQGRPPANPTGVRAPVPYRIPER